MIPDHSVNELREKASHYRSESVSILLEMTLRCWMRAEPKSALEIVKSAQESNSAWPSNALLVLWADADLPAMVRWVETFDIHEVPLAVEAKGLLMHRVDAATRQRWLAEATPKDDDNPAQDLLRYWAAWDPKAAIVAAMATNDSETVGNVIWDATLGPWIGVHNTQHFGLGFVGSLDPAQWPENIRNHLKEHWEQYVLETWGRVDIGETARNGFEFMRATNFAPRENLMKLFGGDDQFASDSDVIDRTFCALRVWAVVKPDEMKKWIAGLDDTGMRKALTWLLEHPWGQGRRNRRHEACNLGSVFVP